MAEYRYTGLDDLQEIIGIAFDKGETVERRISAILDISMLSDEHESVFYRLLDVAGDTSEPPYLRGEVFDQISGRWDTRAIPVLAQALQDESVEVRFWAAFATYTERYVLKYRDFEPLIPLLDKLAASDAVYEGWWHEGREALPALESYYDARAAPVDDGRGHTMLISPMPEYMTFERLKWQNKKPPEQSPLHIDPHWLKYHLRQHFYGIKFDMRRPRLTCYALDWQIGRGKNLLLGALHRDGYGLVVTTRNPVQTARFARWYRSLIPAKVPLYYYDWADQGIELKHGMTTGQIMNARSYQNRVTVQKSAANADNQAQE